jgi:hypothetical protein
MAHFRSDTKLFDGLKPGAYRIEAALSGWTEEKFSDAERSESSGRDREDVRFPWPLRRQPEITTSEQSGPGCAEGGAPTRPHA